MQTHVIAGDFHGQWYDRQLTAMFASFLERLELDRLWINGDAADLSMLSMKYQDHKKYPKWTLKDEIQHTQQMLGVLCENAPTTVFLEGNHEDRWNKYLLTNADKFWDSYDLKTAFAQHGLIFDQWLPYKHHAEITPKLLVMHGELVRSQSGVTARSHLDKFGVSLIHNHSHRMGSYFQTKLSGTKAAWENGCMCQLSMPGQEGPNNWQQGWSVVYVDGSRFHVVQVPVVEYRYVWEGKEYSFDERAKQIYKTLPTAAKGG